MKRIILFAAGGLLVVFGCGEEEGDGAVFVTEGRRPAWGPNGEICYVYGGGLWTCDTNGNRKKRITPEEQWCQDPDWRPDGREIIYRGEFKEDGDQTRGLYVISSTGGEPRFLLKGDYETPAWSPDAEYVVAVSRWGLERDPGLYSINVDTLEILRFPLKNTPYNPDWSPDGKWVVFAQAPYESEALSEAGLWFVSAEGKDLKRLIGVVGADDPSWSGDGKSISYAVNNGDIYRLNLKTGKTEKVTTSKGYEPTWSPDCRAIAFASVRDGSKEGIFIIYP